MPCGVTQILADRGLLALVASSLSHSYRATSNASCLLTCTSVHEANIFEGFDPGSERTLAAWIRHASRTNPRGGNSAGGSGERGSKAWLTYPGDGDSRPNGRVIPGDLARGHPLARKRISPREGLTWY